MTVEKTGKERSMQLAFICSNVIYAVPEIDFTMLHEIFDNKNRDWVPNSSHVRFCSLTFLACQTIPHSVTLILCPKIKLVHLDDSARFDSLCCMNICVAGRLKWYAWLSCFLGTMRKWLHCIEDGCIEWGQKYRAQKQKQRLPIQILSKLLP